MWSLRLHQVNPSIHWKGNKRYADMLVLLRSSRLPSGRESVFWVVDRTSFEDNAKRSILLTDKEPATYSSILHLGSTPLKPVSRAWKG